MEMEQQLYGLGRLAKTYRVGNSPRQGYTGGISCNTDQQGSRNIVRLA